MKNKLTKLFPSKLKAKYDAVNDVDEGETNGISNGSTSSVPASTSTMPVKERKTLSTFFRQNWASVVIVFLLTIIFALAGQRASTKDEAAELVENKTSVSQIKWRPCQIYRDPGASGVKILQTSLGDPSNQWGQVPCLVRHPDHSFNKNTYEDPQWSWLFGINSEQTNQPLEYGMPSAVIKTNFEKIAHPKREPIMGFGGAFTEASALNYMSLDKKGRDAILELLFGKDGLGYSLGRVHINSCDFSVESYSFDDVDGDFELEHFDMKVEHDVMNGMIQFLQQADRTLTDSWPEDSLKVMASPWSPPAWMKNATDQDPPGSLHSEVMTGSTQPSCLRDGTGPESKYAESWALYFSKWLSAYKSWGVELYAVTVQNEPEFPAPWEACSYTDTVEADFVAYHLGPRLEEDHPNVKLLIFDHNKDHAPKWANTIMNSTHPASKYVDGTAVHWYAGGMDRLLDGAVGSPNMHRLLSTLKYNNVKDDHLVLGSEACHCPSTGYADGKLETAWGRAERYAHTILSDLAAGSNGWVEWNLVLDAIGGPNHLGNMCDAPLLAVPYRAVGEDGVAKLPSFEHANYPFGKPAGDSRTREELHGTGTPTEYLDLGVVVQPMFFYMGHISRHIRPGSRAVHAIVDHSEFGPVSRTFRQGVDGVAGGGVNSLARYGVEITLWPCEGSTRQKWIYTDDGKFKVNGHDWLDRPTESCLRMEADEAFNGMLLTGCADVDVGFFKFSSVNETLDTINLQITNADVTEGSNCLIALPLEGKGGALGPRGGAQVNIGQCDQPEAVWKFDDVTGELTSSFFESEGGDVCATTGWPFLQVGAFVDKKETSKTMIVLNEASDPANYILRGDDGEIIMTNSIPAHSIQTVIL